jgi:plastocyanin
VIRRRFLYGLLALPFGLSARRTHAAGTTVEMRKLAFVPAEVTVKAGARITFVNADLVPHTATARDGSFDSSTLKAGENVDIVVASVGDVPFFCRFHPHMTGILHVT